MAEEEETREVLFPDWKGADETGLTIEQTSEGEIFVRGVRGESPAARSGKVYEGWCMFVCFFSHFRLLTILILYYSLYLLPIMKNSDYLLGHLLHLQVTRSLVPLSILTT